MDRFDAMSMLLTAVEMGSFSAAGRRLGVPLPTVSRKISELEAHLNTQLLIRSTRQLTLTDAGAAYVADAKRILEEVADAERAAAGEYIAPRGDLVITAPIVLGRLHVLPVVSGFLAQYPEIAVSLLLSDRFFHLVDDHIDVAVRIGLLPDSSLIATRVGLVRRVVCGSPAYFAGHGIPKSPADLVELSCIMFDVLHSAAAWTFPKGSSKAEAPVPIRPRLTVNTAEAAIDAAIAGIGVTRVMSYQVARAVDEGRLRIVLEKFEPEPWPINVVHAPQTLLPLKVRKFLEFAIPRLREVLPEPPVRRVSKR